jgi:hypothetical protein
MKAKAARRYQVDDVARADNRAAHPEAVIPGFADSLLPHRQIPSSVTAK